MMPLALSFDHRVMDGAEAARFMNDLKALLEDPLRMLVDMA
jgi:pyruvate dehydrogenase E2 component (dihydrolipoamide acetyltransferase)